MDVVSEGGGEGFEGHVYLSNGGVCLRAGSIGAGKVFVKCTSTNDGDARSLCLLQIKAVFTTIHEK